ncbi:hypothetical protein TYRP_012766 [Tyrophagus putrescentiae]|nr:hypothetical protein TYRP_012766 [Tyrophagus putrescentiae]
MVPGLGVRLGVGHRIAHPLVQWLRAQVLDLSEDAVVVEDKVGRPFQGHSQVGLRWKEGGSKLEIRNPQ